MATKIVNWLGIPENLNNIRSRDINNQQLLDGQNEIKRLLPNDANDEIFKLKPYNRERTIFYRRVLNNGNNSYYLYFCLCGINNETYLILFNKGNWQNNLAMPNITWDRIQHVQNLINRNRNIFNNINTIIFDLNRRDMDSNLISWLSLRMKNDNNTFKFIYNHIDFANSIELRRDDSQERPGFMPVWECLCRNIFNCDNGLNFFEWQANNAAHRYYVLYYYIPGNANNVNNATPGTLILIKAYMNLTENQKEIEKGNYRNILAIQNLDGILENANLFSHSYMETVFFEDAEEYRKLLRDFDKQRSFLALSREEYDLLNNLMITAGERRFPVFIKGRAGSGKTVMLQYILCEYLIKLMKEYAQGNNVLYFPIYLVPNEMLIDKNTIIKNIKSRVLHYLHNENLTNEQINKISSFFDEKVDKIFVEYRKLLESLIRENNPGFFLNNRNQEKTYLSYKDFYEWYMSLGNNPYPANTVWHIIRSYIKGTAIDGNYTDINEFNKMSAVFGENDVSEYFQTVYNNIFPQYENFLMRNNKYDDGDLVIEAMKHVSKIQIPYAALICDEAQDFTYLDFQFLGRILVYSKYNIPPECSIKDIPIILAGDFLQTINPSGFNENYVTANYHVLYRLLFGKEPQINADANLEYNYRSAENIGKLNNAILEYRNDGQNVQRLWRQDPGEICFGTLSNFEKLTELDDRLSGKALIAVNENLRNQIEGEFKKKRVNVKVYSPSDVKGLEFSSVVVFVDSNGEFANGFEKKCFLNNLYVATSRARNKLFVIRDNNYPWVDVLNIAKDAYLTAAFNEDGLNRLVGDTENDIFNLAENLFDRGYNKEYIDRDTRIIDLQNAIYNYGRYIAATVNENANLVERARKNSLLANAKISELNSDYVNAVEFYFNANENTKALECLWLSKEYSQIIEKVNTLNLEQGWLYRLSKVLISYNNAERPGRDLHESFLNTLLPNETPKCDDIMFKNDEILSKLTDSIKYLLDNNYEQTIISKLNWMKKLSEKGYISNGLIDVFIGFIKRKIINRGVAVVLSEYRDIVKFLNNSIDKSLEIYKLIKCLDAEANINNIRQICSCLKDNNEFDNNLKRKVIEYVIDIIIEKKLYSSDDGIKILLNNLNNDRLNYIKEKIAYLPNRKEILKKTWDAFKNLKMVLDLNGGFKGLIEDEIINDTDINENLQDKQILLENLSEIENINILLKLYGLNFTEDERKKIEKSIINIINKNKFKKTKSDYKETVSNIIENNLDAITTSYENFMNFMNDNIYLKLKEKLPIKAQKRELILRYALLHNMLQNRNYNEIKQMLNIENEFENADEFRKLYNLASTGTFPIYYDIKIENSKLYVNSTSIQDAHIIKKDIALRYNLDYATIEIFKTDDNEIMYIIPLDSEDKIRSPRGKYGFSINNKEIIFINANLKLTKMEKMHFIIEST